MQAVDQLSQLASRNGGNIEVTAWQEFIQGRKQDLETVLELESLQAERKHSLTASEAEQVMAGSTLSGKLQFPLSLGEIREQRQKLTLEVSHLESIVERAGLPATAQRLFSMRSTMVDGYNRIFSSSLIPPGSHTESVFMGLMLLFGIPVFAIFYWLSPRIQSRIPGLEVLDSLAYRVVGLGFPIYTFGALICGAIWAHYAWGKWWSNDPRKWVR